MSQSKPAQVVGIIGGKERLKCSFQRHTTKNSSTLDTSIAKVLTNT